MEAWRIAIHRYQENLSVEERRLWADSRPEDIIRDFEASQIAREHSSKIRSFLQHVSPLVSAMERFAKPMDVMSGASPEILSPLWGSLRALLIIARDFEAYYIRLGEMLQRIGDALPRYQTYEEIFAKHERLQEAISAAYLEILTFLAKARQTFSKPSFRILAKVTWKSFDSEFESSILSIRRWTDRIEREATAAHMKDAAESRTQILDLKTMIEAREREPSLKEIRTWLHARQCHEERDVVDETRLPGTCEWILRRPELSEWLEKGESQLFWARGPPGCGKSYLYAKIIEHLQQLDRPLVYFLFCGADRQRVTTVALLRSWTFQLAKVCPEALNIIRHRMTSSDNTQATGREVTNLFLSLLPQIPDIHLTLDALDECSDRNEFFNLLSKIPKRFKVLILSRELPDLDSYVSRQQISARTLTITPDMLEQDIHQFINHILSPRMASLGPELYEAVRQRLIHSGGMFLYVRLMFEHISNQTCEFDILQCLNELPDGLESIYDGIIAGMDDLSAARKALALKVFYWVSVAQRPLTVNEMCGLLAVRPGADQDHAFDESRCKLMEPESTILAVCGTLIQARYKERLLYPAHFTVTEYLQKYVNQDHVIEQLAKDYGTPQILSSQCLAASACLRYLSSTPVTNFIEQRMAAPAKQFEISQIMYKDLAIDFSQPISFAELAKLSGLSKQFFLENYEAFEALWEFKQSHVGFPLRYVASYWRQHLDLVTTTEELPRGLLEEMPKASESQASLDFICTLDQQFGLYTWTQLLTAVY